ncbi:NLR family CARD domain-containing protein 3 [Bombina bombina]|uniref:NLR family CARD domain-containing protein 3 n=1 Tax=Bombina bombina TaxID=8345 RepID=UPI00235AA53A|nr:NLR family CARD domain-containing protein 3 [Bombina bombina]
MSGEYDVESMGEFAGQRLWFQALREGIYEQAAGQGGAQPGVTFNLLGSFAVQRPWELESMESQEVVYLMEPQNAWVPMQYSPGVHGKEEYSAPLGTAPWVALALWWLHSLVTIYGIELIHFSNSVFGGNSWVTHNPPHHCSDSNRHGRKSEQEEVRCSRAEERRLNCALRPREKVSEKQTEAEYLVTERVKEKRIDNRRKDNGSDCNRECKEQETQTAVTLLISDYGLVTKPSMDYNGQISLLLNICNSVTGLWILRYRRQLGSCICPSSMQEIWKILQELQVLNDEEKVRLHEIKSLPQWADALLDTLAAKGKNYLQALQSCIENSRSHLYLQMRYYDPVVLKHLDGVAIIDQYFLLAPLGSLLLVEGLTDAQLQEHDIVQLELGQGGRGSPKRLSLEKLLLPLSQVSLPPRITLTLGVAGAGKSTLVRLFVERWTRGEVCPSISCILAINLWELNIYDRLSTEQLVRLACPRYSVPLPGSLLILDGLDELRAALDFSDSIACTDPQRELSPECLITNILRGNLLPDTCVWVTSRPGAAAKIPGGLVDRMTEIPGLETDEVRRYLGHLLPNSSNVAEQVWRHLQCHRSLQSLCSVPTLCRIIGLSLGYLLHIHEPTYIPTTLSAIFSWYLRAQLGDKEVAEQSGSSRRTLGNLGRLAFQGLLRKRSVFYESDLKSCGIDTPLTQGSLCAHLLLQQDSPMCCSFRFPHLSMQEFLAATHYHSAAKRAIFDLFADGGMSWPKLGFLNHYKSTVQRAMQPEGGQLPVFLRFVTGLLSPQVLRVLAGWLPGKEEPSVHRGAVVDHLQYLLSMERTVSCRAVNLVCCLHEVGHVELTTTVEEGLKNGTLGGKLNPLSCCALAYLLRASQSCTQEINLSQCLNYSLVQSLLPQLQYCTNLRMDNNNFQDVVMELLASVLRAKDCAIQSISLAENRLSNRGAKVLGRALMVNQSLSVLDLHGNSIGPSGARALADALQNNQVLLSLNLQNNEIKAEGTHFLSQSLLVNRKLRVLKLSSNCLGDRGATSLAEALPENLSLKTLDLQSNSISNRGLNSLTKGLSQNLGLKLLNLRENSISIEGARALAESLRKNSTLTHLDLTANLLHDEGAEALAGALKENQTLESLHLQWNFLRVGSARSMADALRINKSLCCLDVQENSLGDEGMAALSDALQENSTLSALYLQGTMIGPSGAQSLAEALMVNRSLTMLDLRGNNIGLRGAKALAGALRQNTSLQTLNLQENSIGLDGAICLANAVSGNRSLLSLSLQGNHIGQSGAKVISDTIKNVAPHCRVDI